MKYILIVLTILTSCGFKKYEISQQQAKEAILFDYNKEYLINITLVTPSFKGPAYLSNFDLSNLLYKSGQKKYIKHLSKVDSIIVNLDDSALKLYGITEVGDLTIYDTLYSELSNTSDFSVDDIVDEYFYGLRLKPQITEIRAAQVVLILLEFGYRIKIDRDHRYIIIA